MRGCVSLGALGLGSCHGDSVPVPSAWDDAPRYGMQWLITVRKSLPCPRGCCGLSPREGTQHPSIGKSPLAGGFQGEGVSGHEL